MFAQNHSKPTTNVVELEPPKRREVAPGTDISYDPQLIARFMDVHKRLADTIIRLRAAAMDHQYTDTQQHLSALKSMLQEHLLEVNVRLYTYLSYCLKHDPKAHELMAGMRSAMGRFSRAAMAFTNEYIETGVNKANVTQFVSRLDQMTRILADRIQQEENSLYSLYKPPGSFVS